MNDEYSSLLKNKTWLLVKKLEDTKMVGCKWLYKFKEDVIMIKLIKHKARLVV